MVGWVPSETEDVSLGAYSYAGNLQCVTMGATGTYDITDDGARSHGHSAWPVLRPACRSHVFLRLDLTRRSIPTWCAPITADRADVRLAQRMPDQAGV